MLVSEYDKFVTETDQYRDNSDEERQKIALYGLVGEIGSLVSAVKKLLLSEGGNQTWNIPNEEIVEELGDVVWYCFSLSQVLDSNRNANILIKDIALLKKEVGANDERAHKIGAALDKSNREAFLKAAGTFPNTEKMVFSDYQKVAFLTARTDGKILLEVCLAVLWQLGAELLRNTLPDIELELNKSVINRDPHIVLGEIAWHVAAIASLYKKSLDDIVEQNKNKASFRAIREERTPLHDDDVEDERQKLPRKFEVSFVSVSSSHARMYLNGKRLGNELTDNAYRDDGYRFHDVMHLANAAILGWSPVLRSLLKRKRKYDEKKDEVEDGARARIVEELVNKAIHVEGVRLAPRQGADENPRFFPNREQISFKLLKSLREFVKGLEAEENKYWEWEDAIFEGAGIYHALHKEGQGTVTVDLNNRSIDFRPEVCVGINGVVCGIGCIQSKEGASRESVVAQAILRSLSFHDLNDDLLKQMKVRILLDGNVSVKARSDVQQRIWEKKAIDFKITNMDSVSSSSCTAVALADPKDFLD